MPSAGDVERFVYCAHNWWLAKQGHDADKDAMRGVEAHNRIGEALHETERHRRENLRALRWSFRGAAVAGALTIATLAIIGFDRTAESYILLTAALVMLNGSVGLLTIAMVEERTIKRIQREMGLVPGVLVDDDLAGDGELLAAAFEVLTLTLTLTLTLRANPNPNPNSNPNPNPNSNPNPSPSLTLTLRGRAPAALGRVRTVR